MDYSVYGERAACYELAERTILLIKRLLSSCLATVLLILLVPIGASALTEYGVGDFEQSIFESPDDAAKHFAQQYFPITEYVQFEIATIIYSYPQEGGTPVFSYLKPVAGNVTSVQPLLLDPYLPKEADMVAVAHTHPMGSTSFSGSDKTFAHTVDVPVYLVGTKTHLSVYEKTIVKGSDGRKNAVWDERIVAKTMEFNELSELELLALYYLFKPRWEALADSSNATDRMLYNWSQWPNTKSSTTNSPFTIEDMYLISSKNYLPEMFMIDIQD